MLTLHLKLQQPLMVISLSPRPLQLPHLILVQPPPSCLLQLASADLRQSSLLLGRAQLGLVTRLHPDAERRVEGDGVGVASDVGGFGGRLSGRFYREERVA